jgi:hypothetical protein
MVSPGRGECLFKPHQKIKFRENCQANYDVENKNAIQFGDKIDKNEIKNYE